MSRSIPPPPLSPAQRVAVLLVLVIVSWCVVSAPFLLAELLWGATGLVGVTVAVVLGLVVFALGERDQARKRRDLAAALAPYGRTV